RLRTDEVPDRRGDLAARSFLAVHGAHDRNQDDHERRERKEREEPECACVLKRIALQPALRGFLEQLHENGRSHIYADTQLHSRRGWTIDSWQLTAREPVSLLPTVNRQLGARPSALRIITRHTALHSTDVGLPLLGLSAASREPKHSECDRHFGLDKCIRSLRASVSFVRCADD